MGILLFLEQLLNGLQLGTMLFLMASGLTLVFGIMNFVNLAHGSLYMMGAYFAATLFQLTGSLLLASAGAFVGVLILGMALEAIILRGFYHRDHLDQVLATFGLILFFNELVRMIWGPQAYFLALPEMLNGSIELIPGAPYPVYRLLIILIGVAVGAFLYMLITHSRLGMLIRAGASNRGMIESLGVNIRILFTLVFGLGAALAGLAGTLAGPLLAVQVGMGDGVLITTLVVIVIGGIGSVRGAFLAALLVGLVDTFGRMLLPASLAEMSIYILMAAILWRRPQGLFPAHG
ncbi:inner-membrane translocator [Paramagnetospirillum caucaseum]|uniref:Inner-membrane translocator n=1 Tax=Paramagnetospirillum caucaseum TaxID=1244869 RepID=M2ZPR4_9PROT|nr:branched-chain amino acid ABC transporter permease [Paramagnetospirillum caucaseum]EME69292.1 inner-membrane translocator [Paramagnetospirillum caucaseum]